MPFGSISVSSNRALFYGGSVGIYVGVSSGQKVLKYRQLIKQGLSATSPYVSEKYAVTARQEGNFTATVHLKDGVGPGIPLIIQDVKQGFHPLAPSEAEMNHRATDLATTDAEALAKLYERIRAVRSQMNGLQFLGELRESIHMIRHPANALIKGMTQYHDALKSRAFRSIKSVPRSRRANIIKDVASGLWLEYSYGWKPLLKDVKDIAETVGRTITERQQTRSRCSATKESTANIAQNYSSSATGYNGYIPISSVNHIHSTVGVKWDVGLTSAVVAPSNSLARVAEISGFTLENFVPTVWELLPYSFVLEYFSNIGDIISASCMSTAGISWRSKSVRTKTVNLKVALAGTPPVMSDPFAFISLVSSVGHLGLIQVEKTSLTRLVPDQLPIPDLTLHLPGSDNKYVNLAALLVQSSRITSRGLAA